MFLLIFLYIFLSAAFFAYNFCTKKNFKNWKFKSKSDSFFLYFFSVTKKYPKFKIYFFN